MTVTRVEMHRLVWSTPMQRLAKDFGISNVALSKHCRNASVPVPPSGWWARKDAGKSPEVQALPALPIGRGEETLPLVLPSGWASETNAGVPAPEGAPPFYPDIKLFEAEVAKAVIDVKVSANLARPHHLVAKLLAHDAARRARANPGSVTYAWMGPRFDTPHQRRRLRILSALLTALQKLGCTVSGAAHAGEEFGVAMRGTRLTFVLAVEEGGPGNPLSHRRWRSRDGKTRLRLELDPPEPQDTRGKAVRTWADDERPLERQLSDVVRFMLVYAEQKARAWAATKHVREVEFRRYKEAERRQLAEQAEADRLAREAAEKERRVRALLKQADALGRADRIRQYVADVRARLTAGGGAVASEELEAWSAWALREADGIDPVVNGEFLQRIGKA